MAKLVRVQEENMAAKLPLIPAPLRAEPKVAQAIEDLERYLGLPEDKRGDDVSKRLQNLINLSSEIEQFQQTVVLRQELRRDGAGREFNMEVIYFGLSVAYAVNEDGGLALVGKPDPKDGWKFTERKELAGAIRDLISSTKGDRDPSFISLPISLDTPMRFPLHLILCLGLASFAAAQTPTETAKVDLAKAVKELGDTKRNMPTSAVRFTRTSTRSTTRR